MKSGRISLNSNGNLVLPTNPDVADNSSQIATTQFVRSAINTHAVTGSITTAKIDDQAITTAKIASNTVTTNKIASNAVTTNKIADGNITSSKLNSSIVINNLNIANFVDGVNIVSQTLVNNTNSGSSSQGTAISSTGQYQVSAITNIIFVSNDYGSTWTTNNYSINPYSASITSSGQTMYIANSNGNALYSTDYGQTWNTHSNITGAKNIVISGDGIKILYTKNGTNKLFLSTNSGISFTEITSVPQAAGIGMSKNGMYMVTRSISSSYISSNGGSTWSTLSTNLGGGHMPNIAISSDGQYMIATADPGYSTNYFSSNYGVTWTTKTITSAYRCDISDNGKYMILNTYGGKFRYSYDYGVTFTESSVANISNYSQACSISGNGKYILIVDNNGYYSYKIILIK